MSEASQDQTAGALLRRAREAAGLHVAALAVSLKVPVRKLEALEADRYDELPDAVFARALASSVCRNLKIDPQPILDRLPQTAAPRLAQTRDSINAPFRVPGEPTGTGWTELLRRPAVVAVAVLLLGALVIVFLPDLRREEAPVAKAEPTGARMAEPVVLQPAAVEAAPAALPSLTAAPSTGADASRLQESGATTAAGVPQGSTATSAALPAGGLVVFRVSGPSWIQVTDAKGAVALRRELAAGESATASGPLPLAVTVGSASVTSVEVRGKAFDLAAVTRDNVARFEVK